MSQVGLKFKRITLTGDASAPDRFFESRTTTNYFEIHNLTGNSSVYAGDKNITSNAIPIAAAATKTYSSSTDSNTHNGDFFDLSDWYAAGVLDDIIIVAYLVTEK